MLSAGLLYNASKLAASLYLLTLITNNHFCRPRCVTLASRQMIVGTGVDIVEVPRIQRSVERFGQRFLNRVFTPGEIHYCTSRANAAERLAGRFAAKEAAMKAIGTGLRHGVTWHDVEVVRQPGRRPELQLTGKAAEFAVKLGCGQIHLSLSHTADHAIAHVILEGLEKGIG